MKTQPQLQSLNVYLTSREAVESWATTQEDWERTAGRKGAMQRNSARCGLSQRWNWLLFESLPPPLPSTKVESVHRELRRNCKTYHSDLIWFYNRLLWFKKATECQRQRKMGLKLFKSGVDCREWLTKTPLMLPHLTCMIPITLCAAVCLFTSRVKLSLAL